MASREALTNGKQYEEKRALSPRDFIKQVAERIILYLLSDGKKRTVYILKEAATLSFVCLNELDD